MDFYVSSKFLRAGRLWITSKPADEAITFPRGSLIGGGRQSGGSVNSMAVAPQDDAIRDLLTSARTIAVVGASPKAERPVYGVMRYLIDAGYRVVPVNPGHAGGEILGRPVFARLADIPGPIDIVDIFRRPSALAGVVDEALRLDPLPKTIWMQLGLRDDAAAAKAEAVGLAVVMNRCIKIEHARLI